MSRYISLDWLNAHINYICERGRKDISQIIYTDKLNDAPSIDIVRCKECRYWHREINENGVEYINFSKCTKGHHGNGLDFYCTDGEREDE